MTVKSKKRRLQRARAHQAQSKGRDQFHRAFDKAGLLEKEDAVLTGRVLTMKDVALVSPYEQTQKRIQEAAALAEATGKPVVIAQQTPSRAKCPSCGTSQKVRKDGTLGKHSPTRTDTSECSGSGKQWNAS